VLRTCVLNLALAVAYFAAAQVGFAFAFVNSSVTLVCPAAGIALAALLLGGWQYVPGIVVGAAAAGLAHGLPAGSAAAIGVGNAAGALAGWWLLVRAPQFDSALARVRDVVRLASAAALGAAIVAAVVGTTSLVLGGLLEPDRWTRAALTWWVGDALGMMLVAPVAFTWAHDRSFNLRLVHALAHALLIALVLFVGATLLAGHLGREKTEFLAWFALFPLAIWPAVRFPMREVATFNLVLSAMCIAGAWFQIDPFAGQAAFGGMMAAPGLLGSVTVTTLLLGALSTERRMVAERLRRSEARFRSLTNLSVDWYWEQDEELRFTHLSPGMLVATPFDPADQIGRRRWELPYEGLNSPEWAEHRRKVEAHEPFRDFMVVRPGPNGRRYYVLTSGEPVFDEQGRFKGYRGVARDITPQKEAEAQLRESRELFLRIFSSSPMPMLISHFADSRVLEVNAAWLNFFGRDRAAVVGQTLEALDVLQSPADRARVIALLANRGTARNFELPVRGRGGEPRVVLYSGELVDLAGVRCVISTLTDVTDRNRALAELRSSRERLERLFRGSPLPVAISSIEHGAVIDVNDAWTRSYGYSREEILGRNFVELGLWVDPEARRRLRDQLRAGGVVRNFECKWRKRSGDIADVLLSGDVIELDGEAVMLSTSLEVTERKRAEQRLRESEERFVKIFQSSPVPVVISRLDDGCYLEVNDAWSKWFGYLRDEVIGKSSLDLQIWLHTGDRNEFRQMLATGIPVRNMECRFRKRSGEIADVLLSAELLELGGLQCVVTSLMDITERKNAERQLRESERRFRDFAEAAG